MEEEKVQVPEPKIEPLLDFGDEETKEEEK